MFQNKFMGFAVPNLRLTAVGAPKMKMAEGG